MIPAIGSCRSGYVVPIALACLLGGPLFAQKPQSSGRIGDLAVTFLKVREEASSQTDYHMFVVRVRAENVGKKAICVSLRAKLKASFDLEYNTSLWDMDSHGPRIHELLPGEEVEGEYAFRVKNGANPVEMVLRQESSSQTCGSDRRAARTYDEEIRIGLTPLQQSTKPAAPGNQDESGKPARRTQDPERKRKVYVSEGASGRKSGVLPDSDILKSFAERCPGLTLTVDREVAGYIMVVQKAGWSRSDHSVSVLDQSGNVVHVGKAFRLRNAIKDACLAILQELGSEQQANR